MIDGKRLQTVLNSRLLPFGDLFGISVLGHPIVLNNPINDIVY
jgi:hypothetical protein